MRSVNRKSLANGTLPNSTTVLMEGRLHLQPKRNEHFLQPHALLGNPTFCAFFQFVEINSIRSLDRNGNRSRGNTVSDDNNLARPQFLIRWHVEMSRDKAAERHGHATMVVRPTIEYVSSRVVGDTHERIVCCRLLIVPVSSPLRHPVKTMARDQVRAAGSN